TISNVNLAMNGYKYMAVFNNGISPSPTVSTAAVTLTVHPVLSITPTPPQGIVGTSYNQTLTVVGGASALTLLNITDFNDGGTGLTPANIPPSPAAGTVVINGTPSGTGTATFTVNAANGAGNTLTQSLSITIRPPLAITTVSLPAVTAGYAYHQTVT